METESVRARVHVRACVCACAPVLLVFAAARQKILQAFDRELSEDDARLTKLKEEHGSFTFKMKVNGCCGERGREKGWAREGEGATVVGEGMEEEEAAARCVRARLLQERRVALLCMLLVRFEQRRSVECKNGLRSELACAGAPVRVRSRARVRLGARACRCACASV
eukprot:5013590-Pleurochrysis_carterae.AAC.1